MRDNVDLAWLQDLLLRDAAQVHSLVAAGMHPQDAMRVLHLRAHDESERASVRVDLSSEACFWLNDLESDATYKCAQARAFVWAALDKARLDLHALYRPLSTECRRRGMVVCTGTPHRALRLCCSRTARCTIAHGGAPREVRAPACREWSKDLKNLLNGGGMYDPPAQVGRNALNLQLIADPLSREGAALVGAGVQLFLQGTALRIGALFVWPGVGEDVGDTPFADMPLQHQFVRCAAVRPTGACRVVHWASLMRHGAGAPR